MDRRFREELVFLYSDNEMSEELVVRFERQIHDDPECAARARYVERLLCRLRGCDRHSAPPHLRSRILAALKQTRTAR